MLTSNATHVQATEFVLRCFSVELSRWRGLVSASLLALFLVATSANLTLLLVIRMEQRLHEPMHYLLSMLSILDLTVALCVVPQVLGNIWFDSKNISATLCFTQLYFILTFNGFQSGLLMVMAYDRYVAICRPLQYPLIINNTLLLKTAVFVVGRSAILTIPTVVSLSQLNYCASNVIDRCYCENVPLANIACNSKPANGIYVIFLLCFTLILDLGLITFSYFMILRVVLQLRSQGATTKAFSTCASHLLVITFLYSSQVALLLANRLGQQLSPDFHSLFAILYCLLPQVFNPLVYGLRTKEIRERAVAIFRNVKVNTIIAN
ncbi:olfactory receptor 56A4-like [Ambystoma mexicanum]|uniref:olfactory receptor 56A4-like n=1 Tax=Ambystoma mexicanum TaxID=8296 RepID=UPI0037E900B8